MKVRKHGPRRPAGALDVAAKLASIALPRALTPAIDQARLDARAVLDQLRGLSPRSFSDSDSAPAVAPSLEEIDPLAVLVSRRFASRVQQARRDFRMIARSARGERTNPLVERKPGGRSLPPPAPASVVGLPRSITPRPMKVVEVVRETDDAVSIYLANEDGSPLPHLPGQFLTFDVDVEGTTLRRAYSLASPALVDARPHVTVKRVAGGRVSNHLNDHVATGQTLQVLGPSGAFVVEPDPIRSRRLVLLAGGSGITPIMSIIETVLALEPASEIVLIYGNRSEKDVIFRDRLAALVDRHAPRLVVDHVLEEGGKTSGRLDATTTTERLDAVGLEGDVEYYVCGPTPMMAAVREALTARGVERIHEERFTSPEDRQPGDVEVGPQSVVIRARGRETTIRADAGQTLLEAGLSAGLDMPFSCAMGGCAACLVHLVEGEVVSDEPNCLTDAERAKGYVLACCSRALSPVTLEVP